MFDIYFIEKSQNLKEKIGSEARRSLNAQDVFTELESYRSKNPQIFNIEITNACNMRCVMCPRTEKMTRSIHSINSDVFEKAIAQITPTEDNVLKQFFSFIEKKFGVGRDEQSEDAFYFHISSRYLTLHGYGESVNDPSIVERVAACSQKGLPTYFSCVPSNINISKTEALMKAGLGVLKFSIDALDDLGMKKIRGPAANFSGAFKKIQDLIQIKNENHYKTLFVATMIEIDSSPEARRLYNDFIEMMKVNGLYAYIKSQDNRWYFEKNPYQLRPCTKEYCEYPWISLTIMADGSVVPCTQDYDCELVMGNVEEKSLEEIWNSQKYQDFREMHVTGKFPIGHKCAERCDQALVWDRLSGKIPKTRII